MLGPSLGFHVLLCVCYVNPAYGCQIEINCMYVCIMPRTQLADKTHDRSQSTRADVFQSAAFSKSGDGGRSCCGKESCYRLADDLITGQRKSLVVLSVVVVTVMGALTGLMIGFTLLAQISEHSGIDSQQFGGQNCRCSLRKTELNSRFLLMSCNCFFFRSNGAHRHVSLLSVASVRS